MASRPSKRRKLTPPRSDGDSSGVLNTIYKSVANWDLEQAYEQKARKGAKRAVGSNRLPIKTADGVLREAEAIEDRLSTASDAEWEDADDEAASPGADRRLARSHGLQRRSRSWRPKRSLPGSR